MSERIRWKSMLDVEPSRDAGRYAVEALSKVAWPGRREWWLQSGGSFVIATAEDDGEGGEIVDILDCRIVRRATVYRKRRRSGGVR